MNAPVYVIGAARSGTTWLQNLLGAHPVVATPQELDLFSLYVAPWHDAWRDQLADGGEAWRRRRYKGLPSVLTEDELVEVSRDAVLAVYERVLARKPSARVLLEKVPNYTLYTTLIHRYFPDARYIHVVRDGRDVACSHLRAARGWGGGWAAASVERAAWMWRLNIELGRRAQTVTPAYLEIRYERLRSGEGPAALAEAFAFCGLDVDERECEQIYERFDLKRGIPPSSIVWGGEVTRRLDGEPAEPEGFFGEGSVGAWREQFTPAQRWTFERVAGHVLRELGYEDDASWTRVGRVRGALAAAALAAARATHSARMAAGAARASLARTRNPRPFVPEMYAPPAPEEEGAGAKEGSVALRTVREA